MIGVNLNLLALRRACLASPCVFPFLHAHVVCTLAALEESPAIFGPPREQEDLVLLLVKVRWLLTRPESIDVVDELLVRFTNELNGRPYYGPLWALLREEVMLNQHPQLLGDFARWVAQEWPPT